MAKIQRAIISVFDKDGLEPFARGLHKHGVQILSSGGTAKFLTDRGLPVTPISEYTGSPEILDGRVKTLHPKIFGGILCKDIPAHQSQIKEHGMLPLDLVVVNLYPFEKTVAKAGVTEEQIIEMIDIGGPSLIRAAAKNHQRVTVVVDPGDYQRLLTEIESNQGQVGASLRRELTFKAFAHTAAYDTAIASYFQGAGEEKFPPLMTLPLARVQSLRYGENPHQAAALYRNLTSLVEPAIVKCEQLQGKELSYNNILDADAALNLVLDLFDTAVCIIKHTNPCGAAVTDDDLVEAFRRAKTTDPVSAFGGIVSCNRSVNEALAQELKEMFLEAVIAPGYDPGALEILRKKKNLRLLCYPSDALKRQGLQLRSVSGGLLVQDTDHSIENMREAKVMTKRAPTPQELKALDFAWRICKHVKSNAIVFATAGQLVGVGAGQMSRVDSVKLAATKAQLPLQGSVMASDAFFPFRDGIDAAFNAGATAVVQPGGSIRDQEVIDAADEHNMAMILTGVRHFRH